MDGGNYDADYYQMTSQTFNQTIIETSFSRGVSQAKD